MKHLPLTVALVLTLFGLCAAVPQTALAADEGAAKAALPAIHQAVRAEKIDDVKALLDEDARRVNSPPPRLLPAPVAARGQGAKQVFDAATLAAAKVGYEFVEGIQRGSHQNGARYRKTQDGQAIQMQFSVVTLSGGGFRFTCITSARDPRYRNAFIRAYRKAFFDGLGIESARNASFTIEGNLMDE